MSKISVLLLCCIALLASSAGATGTIAESQKETIQKELNTVPVAVAKELHAPPSDTSNVANKTSLILSNVAVPMVNTEVHSQSPNEQIESVSAAPKGSETFLSSTTIVPVAAAALSNQDIKISSDIKSNNNSNTTTSTTTTKPTTTTTTTTIITTTAAPVTTTALPPAPIQPPTHGKWAVNETNQTCILIQMAVQYNVSYVDKENKTAFKVFNLPSNNETVVSEGKCGKDEQNLTLSWNVTQNVKNNFTLHFVKMESSKQYSLHHLELNLAPIFLPKYNSNKTLKLVHNASEFAIGISNSYRCMRAQNLNLTQNGTVPLKSQLTISDLQFQAFKADSTMTFGIATDCIFETPDIVPIVVGCTLAGLVVIVLISYLVSRRRSQNRGYLSV